MGRGCCETELVEGQTHREGTDCLPEVPKATRGNYEEAKKALKERFEPESRRERYRAEFQVRRRRKEESWSDFVDNLKLLVDKAYPDLDEKARDQLALNHYLGQLADPQIIFSIKQKCPKTLDEAVGATH